MERTRTGAGDGGLSYGTLAWADGDDRARAIYQAYGTGGFRAAHRLDDALGGLRERIRRG
ncbi:MAG: hypothetical protein H6811_00535 [Phycisphaeraceae bacterium]|nr:hypothetical protein [Phycisphaeraceae bacterium]